MLCQSVAWEQVLDTSDRASIQHAATKVTDTIDTGFRVRLHEIKIYLFKLKNVV